MAKPIRRWKSLRALRRFYARHPKTQRLTTAVQRVPSFSFGLEGLENRVLLSNDLCALAASLDDSTPPATTVYIPTSIGQTAGTDDQGHGDSDEPGFHVTSVLGPPPRLEPSVNAVFSNQFVVQLKPGRVPEKLAKDLGAKHNLSYATTDGVQLWSVPEGSDPIKFLAKLRRDPRVVDAYPVYDQIAPVASADSVSGRAAGVPTFTETESNNTAASANDVGTLTGIPAIVAGSIATTGDVDFFKFTLTEHSGVFFDIDSRDVGLSTTLNSVLTLYNSAGSAISGATNTNGFDFDGFALNNTSSTAASFDSSLYWDLDAGTYNIRVSQTGSTTGNYQLKMYADNGYTSTVPIFSSLTGASRTLYLDFDGHSANNDAWGNYTIAPFDFSGNAAELTPGERAAIYNVWRAVAEDFAPFNINVTTSYSGSYANNTGFRMVVGGNGTEGDLNFSSGTLGVAYVDSYANFGSSYKTAFVFADNFNISAFVGTAGSSGQIMSKALEMANTASHEFGHALGLVHYGGTNGQNNGIMHTPDFGLNRERWKAGNTKSDEPPVVAQDDVVTIAARLGYKADDHGNTTGTATALGAGKSGIIGTTADLDYFSFTASGQNTIHLDVDEYVANLDAVLRVYDGSGTLLATSAPTDSLGVTLTFAGTGTHYIQVASGGAAGSGEIGQYSIWVDSVIDDTGPRVLSHSPTDTNTAGSVTLTFNEPILDGSFTLADIVSFTGPSGAIAATAVNKVSSTEYSVAFATQTTPGTYTLVVGPQILDQAGNAMDQNTNGTSGESPADRYSAVFTITDTPPVTFEARFDFGTSSSPVASGYTQIAQNTGYALANGYGWQSGTIKSADRVTGSDLNRDMNYTSDGTFAVDLPNGYYDVTLTMGDVANTVRDQMAVYFEGVKFDTVTTPGTVVVSNTYTVNVSDGQLTFRLHDEGGANLNASILGMAIVNAAPPPPDTTGPRVTGHDPLEGVGSINAITFTFNEPVLDGSFTVADVVSITGPGGAITATGVNKVSDTEYTVTFATQSAMGSYSMVIGPDILDVAGNAMDQNQNGTNGQSPADHYTAGFSVVSVATIDAKFDFGTTTSPVQAGYIGMAQNVAYTPALGYGWQSGTIKAADRAVGSELERDFHYAYEGVFGYDLPNGFYDVTLTTGDLANTTRDNMAIYFEGVKVDTVTAPLGTVLRKTYSVQVTDGQLNFGFIDEGGANYNATFGGIEIATAPPPPPDTVGPRVVSHDPVEGVGSINAITLTFNEAILDGSFTLGDIVSFTGPNGAITATAVNKVSDTAYTVTFPTQSTLGSYSLVVGPDIRDTAGNQMDQNQNSTNGQSPGDRYTAAFSVVATATIDAKFDFGTSNSPVQSGYVGMGPTVSYTPALGYGWLSGTIKAADRAVGSDLERDLHYTSDGTFVFDLPNGNYDVTVTIGDTAAGTRDNMAVYLEGFKVDSVSTSGGTVLRKTYPVSVFDGQLTFRLLDEGGANFNATIQGIEIVTAAPLPPDTTGPRVASHDPAEAVGSINSLTFNFDEPISDGSFTLADIVSFTGPSGAITATAVNKVTVYEYVVSFPTQSTLGGYSMVIGPNILDMAGNQMDQNGNGTRGENPGDRYTAVFNVVSTPTVNARFDMGVTSSPVAEGYVAVLPNTTYNASRGYGWLSGTIKGADRVTGSDLERDMHYTNDGTFVYDLANGNYTVTLTMGDTANTVRDQMAVYFEGVKVDTVTTPGATTVRKTYAVTVNDGQLTFRLHDEGGANLNASILGIEIATAV